MTYAAAQDRYDTMTYRRCGRGGIDLANNYGTLEAAARATRKDL